MGLKAGTVGEFEDSMAHAMEKAFASEWHNVKGFDLPDSGKEDRRLLLAAIAQGVVKHLVEHASEAFQISVGVRQDDSLIASENSQQIDITPSASGAYIKPGDARVTQVEQDQNRVKSSGNARIDLVIADGILY